MKFKVIFAAILATLALATGCEKEAAESFDEIKISQSIVALPAEGGQVKTVVTAVDNWKFEGYDETVSSWLTITPAQGGAGEIEVTFKAEAATESKTAELKLVCANKVQRVTVQQITAKVETPLSTCAEVIAGPDSKTYRVKGVVTAIANTTYGNWYLNDGTGEVYIYGTLDAKGAEKNFASLGIEVGDVVTCEGPKTTYNTTIELVNVTVIDIEKSLIKIESVEPEDAVVAKEGGEFKVELACKGDGVSVEIPEAAKAWLSVTSVTTSGSTASVVFTAAPNEGGDREVTLVFKTSSKGKEYTAQTDLKQEGAIIETTADNINAAEDGATVYRYTGYITKDTGSDYGNIYVKDATGEVYCYGVLNEAGETKKWKEMGINVGDIVTVTGPKTSFNGTPQLKNVSVEKHIKVTDISLADFRKLSDDKNTWYRISGKVGKSTEDGTKYDLDAYGNFALFDGATEVYVYGVKAGWGGAKGEFGKLGVKEGDNLTIVCYKTSYNGLIEADGCFYVSHKADEGGETPNPGGAGKYVKVTASQTDWTGKYLIVFGENAHATISGKDLTATAAVTVSGDAIESSAEVDAAAVTVAKNGEKYSIALPDGKYFGMAHNACSSSASAYDVDFEYTADGIKISGAVSGKTAMYYLYYNSSTAGSNFYRCYVDKTGTTGYALPVLYKYAE